jgi:tetratricopeptide (TPR) repeat protein
MLEPRFPGIGTVPLTPQERTESLRAHLQRVANATSLFTVGLWSYYAGQYPQAIRAFEAFRAVFASREVLHNLAASYHQLALQAYAAWHPKPQSVPFQLSLLIEPLTRASQVYLERTRGPGAEPEAVFRHCLDQAIRGYEEALAQERDFPPALLNLGAALILRGFHTRQVGPIHRDFSQAVARLSSVPDQTPPSPAALNTLGVALWYDERPARAKEALMLAVTLAPDDAAPVFNLAAIARAEHREADAQQYKQRYDQLTAWLSSQPPPAPPSRETLALGASTVAPGVVEHALPPRGDPLPRSQAVVDGTTYAVVTDPSGVRTLVRDGEILMVMAREGYQGHSGQEVGIGSRAADVRTRYGPPSRRQELPHRQNWAYDTQRIAFQLRHGTVVAWLLF